MKLLLTSSGLTNKTIIEAFEKLAEKPASQCSLAYIPTAAHPESGDKHWVIHNLNECNRVGFPFIDIVDIAVLARSVWMERLRDVDVIMVGGGENSFLQKHMQESGFADELPRFLQEKIYVGISAGSMALMPSITKEESETFFGEDLSGTMNITNFWMKPHFNSQDFPERTKENLDTLFSNTPKRTYILDDESAIVVNGQEVDVVSEGQWYSIEPDTEK